MVQHQSLFTSVGVPYDTFDLLARRQFGKANEADTVVFANLVVVGWVLERKGKEALLLHVGLVNSGEAPGYDGRSAQ